MNVKIKLIDGGKMPFKATEGAACYDLCAREIIEVTPFYYEVKLGICLDIPEGYKAEVLGRSGLGKTGWFFTLGTGVGDPDYTGEYRAIFWYNSCAGVITTKEIHPKFGLIEVKKPLRAFPFSVGERCAQFSIEKQLKYNLVEVKEIVKQTKRGVNGFGSTGK